ncbi:MAG TPA: hypothetical protein VGJ92_09360 [Methanocella sp.]|jgi:hypothetical protein
MRLSLRLVCLGLVAATLLLMLPCVSLAAVTNTFPDEPFNHLQVYYSVSGVSVGSPEDTGGDTWVRKYTGKTDSNNIHITGEFRFIGGTGDNTNINCEAGLYTVPWWSGDAPEPLNPEFSKWYVHGDSVPFDLWLNVPQDQKEVQVIIDLDGSYANWQSRGVVVKFVLQNIYYNDGSSSYPGTTDGGTSDDEELAMSPLPLIGAGVLACLYAFVRLSKNR